MCCSEIGLLGDKFSLFYVLVVWKGFVIVLKYYENVVSCVICKVNENY